MSVARSFLSTAVSSRFKYTFKKAPKGRPVHFLRGALLRCPLPVCSIGSSLLVNTL